MGAVVGAGIIPAYAGLTASAPVSEPTPPDHPRLRGVNQVSRSRSSREMGSSPLTRG